MTSGGAGGSTASGGGASGSSSQDAGTPAEGPTLQVMVGVDSAIVATQGSHLDCYVDELMSQVRYTYSKLRPAVTINVMLTRLETNVDKHGLTLSTNKDTLLSNWISFASTLRAANDAGPNHFDYALLLTKTAFGMAGWARTGVGICDAGAGSIVFDKGYPSAKVIAHELGHSFGLSHVAGRDYVMNPNPGTAWSAQSVKVLETSTQNAPCMNDFHPLWNPQLIPTITVEQQCQTRFSEPACTTSAAQTQCAKLLCRQSASSCNYDDSPPLDGSSCGTGKWCIGGQCVAQTGQSTQPSTCP